MYPVMLRLENVRCLVVGGGKTATRKVGGLLEANARVTVVAPSLDPELAELARDGQVEHIDGEYSRGTAAGYRLVIAATNDEETNRQVFRDANEAGQLVNSVDDPENCNFYVPAGVRRGDLVVAVSTSGAAPALARAIRLQLDSWFDDGLRKEIDALKRERSRVLREAKGDSALKSRLFRDVVYPRVRRIVDGLRSK